MAESKLFVAAIKFQETNQAVNSRIIPTLEKLVAMENRKYKVVIAKPNIKGQNNCAKGDHNSKV